MKTTLKTRVSCTIIALNEVDRIARAITSVQDIVEEVIVVDSGSTDGTQKLAQKLGARVISNPFVGYGPQKRFAEDQAKNNWILNLDADEWLSDELCAELAQLLSLEQMPAGSFRMRVTIVYPHRERPAPFADSTVCLRLYDKRRARFSPSLVYDNVPVQPDTKRLKGRVWHKSYRSLSYLVQKELGYYELQKQGKRRNRLFLLLRLPFEFSWQFFKFYILDRHIFGGLYGFAVSVVLASMRFTRIAILLGW